MDDPGGAQNVHANGWLYPKLGEREWAAVGAELRRRGARLSVAYTPGWVDDGDVGRGRLFVDGVPARARARGGVGLAARPVRGREREPAHERLRLGAARDRRHCRRPGSPTWSSTGTRTSTRTSRRGCARPTGTTDRLVPRVRPPRAAAIAERGAGRHPLELGLAALQRIFGVRPTTFVPPGDQFHDDDVETALRLGFSFVESYYLAIRDRDRFLWCQHVCAPYLDLASPDWLAAGLPVVGYFHDNDVSAGGVEWMSRHLDAWADAGVERMIDFRELAAALGARRRRCEREGGPVLTVTSRDGAPRPARPVPVRLAAPTSARRSTWRSTAPRGRSCPSGAATATSARRSPRGRGADDA